MSNFTSDIQDKLIDNLNDFEITLSGILFTLKSYRAEEASMTRTPRIYVDFVEEFAPLKTFVGHRLASYPSNDIDYHGTTIKSGRKPVRGYPCKSIVYVSVICGEKRAHGFDANKLVRNVIERLIIKMNKDWPAILDPCKGDLEGPIGPIRSEPFFIGSEKIYRYTLRFNIFHTLVWTEPDESTDGYICEISGTIDDAINEEQISEFDITL